LASQIETTTIELSTLPLTQGVTYVFNEDKEVSDISNTDLLRKSIFTGWAKMGCFMGVSSRINDNFEL
jgi:hypothetical protein